MAEDHLSAETRAMLGRPAAERLAWFQTEFWIKYPASDAILARLEELVNKPRRARMLDRPAFCRHPEAIIHGNDRGVYEQQQTVHGRVQG